MCTELSSSTSSIFLCTKILIFTCCGWHFSIPSAKIMTIFYLISISNWLRRLRVEEEKDEKFSHRERVEKRRRKVTRLEMWVRWVETREKNRPEVMKSSGRRAGERTTIFSLSTQCGRSRRLQQRKLILQRPSNPLDHNHLTIERRLVLWNLLTFSTQRAAFCEPIWLTTFFSFSFFGWAAQKVNRIL